MIGDVERWLAAVTGYDRVSVQPNAGSQGEFAGLLAIRGYHRSHGEEQRDICLVPSSAHGTNAASAVMAGLRVVVVKCTAAGDVDVDDVRAKVAEHGDRIAAIMLTYPSTHGVFETGLREICDARARRGWAGLRRRCQHERARRSRPAAGGRRGRVTPQPPQDVLHPARRRWSGGRAGGGEEPPRALPAGSSAGARVRAQGARARLRSALGQCRRVDDPVGLPAPDGWRRADPGHRGHGDPGRQLHRRAHRPGLPAALLRATAWSPTSACSTCGRSPRPPASPSRTWPSA